MEESANSLMRLPEDPEASKRKAFMVADIIFSILFLLSFILVLAMSIYNFCKFRNMVNLPNVLVVIMILCTLLSKLFILCF